MRFIGLLKADKHSEAGAPPPKDLMERMGKFLEEITKAGVLLATDGLQPTSYALFQVKSKAEAIEWTTRFLKVLGEGECEIRPLFEPSDFPS